MAKEQHLKTDDARAGATPGIMRYVLGISLALTVIALTLIAVFSYQTGPGVTVTGGTAAPAGSAHPVR